MMLDIARETADWLVSGFREKARIDQLPQVFQSQYDEVAKTAVLDRFPGAILVYPYSDSLSIYYAIASNESEWRKLRPYLISFVGPTLTSFDGQVEPLCERVEVESFLSSLREVQGIIVARIIPGDAPEIRQEVQNSFRRMIQLIDTAPTLTLPPPESTSRLLARFVDCLNGDNYVGAESILFRCKNECLLDALNISFLRVRLLAHFRDWGGICQMTDFNDICLSRKPGLITLLLLEALYQNYLGTLPPDEAEVVWKNEVRPLSRPLLLLPIPLGCGEGALRLYALEALKSESRLIEMEYEVLKYRDSLAGLDDELISAGRDGIVEQSFPPLVGGEGHDDALMLAIRALLDADGRDSLLHIAPAIEQFRSLSDENRSRALALLPVKEILQEFDAEFKGVALPTTWVEWFRRLSDKDFVTAQAVLDHCVREWPVSDIVDPVEIEAFNSAINSVPSDDYAGQRLADALPVLVAWVAEDPCFPRAAMAPLYENLLLHLFTGTRREKEVYESSMILIRAILEIGLEASTYEELLSDCREVAEGVGVRGVYWLLDVIEETIQNSAPSKASRQTFWQEAYSILHPLRDRLQIGQRLAISHLGHMIEWESEQVEAFSVADEDNRSHALAKALEEKSIAIYSLTESATRQAVDALKSICPTVSISTSSASGGTPALKSLAQNADVFVVATASAKHAATGFIQHERPSSKPTLFAAGRGFSSIVRALESYFLADLHGQVMPLVASS